MTRTLLPLLFVPLLAGGCTLLEDGKDLFDGLTNPLVVQALVLGVDLPDDAQGIDFPAEFSNGVAVSAFLADAGNVNDMQNAPIDGATVTIDETSVPGMGDGSYALEPGDLAYVDNAVWPLTIGLAGKEATANIELAPGANLAISQTHKVGATMSIDLTGKGYNGALLVVLNQDGDVTYDNRPTDIKGLYDLTRGGDAGALVIPATAFPAPGAYAVGVAGLRSTKGADNMTKMNTVLSTVMAGKLQFGAVVAAP